MFSSWCRHTLRFLHNITHPGRSISWPYTDIICIPNFKHLNLQLLPLKLTQSSSKNGNFEKLFVLLNHNFFPLILHESAWNVGTSIVLNWWPFYWIGCAPSRICSFQGWCWSEHTPWEGSGSHPGCGHNSGTLFFFVFFLLQFSKGSHTLSTMKMTTCSHSPTSSPCPAALAENTTCKSCLFKQASGGDIQISLRASSLLFFSLHIYYAEDAA